MEQVILLDFTYQPISTISLKKAIKLICKERVEVVQSSDKKIHESLFAPKVVRLLKSIAHMFKRTISWSKQTVFLRDNYICQYCGLEVPKSKATVDHVIPTSRGGKNTFANTVCSCYSCNNTKGNKLNSEAGLTLVRNPRTPTLLDLISIKFKDIDLSGIWN
jgi:5-methylcytosine-specific restriction endonuclease McrA